MTVDMHTCKAPLRSPRKYGLRPKALATEQYTCFLCMIAHLAIYYKDKFYRPRICQADMGSPIREAVPPASFHRQHDRHPRPHLVPLHTS